MRKSKAVEGQQLFTLNIEEVPTVPSVTFHKSGRFVRMKANDTYSADVVREVEGRQPVPWMRDPAFYGVADAKTKMPAEERKLELWRWLETGIESHPIIGILSSYGIHV